MFEAAELGHKLSKAEYDRIEPALRMELLEMQQKLRSAPFPVIIVFAGVDGAGKGETVNLLNGWMDPRWTTTRAYGEPSDEERERPAYWRYWRDLPAKGKVGFLLSAWYSQPLLQHVYGRESDAVFDQRLNRIKTFEQILTDDGAVILKFWMHLGKKQQKHRLRSLEKDPLQTWRVTPRDWKHYKLYDRFIGTAERMLMRTSTGEAPWTIVEGEDARYREVTVATIIRDVVLKRLDEVEQCARMDAEEKARAAANGKAVAAKVLSAPQRKSRGKKKVEVIDAEIETEGVELQRQTILQSLDMTQALAKKTYARQLSAQQARVGSLFRAAKQRGLSLVLVFEGWDAAGKGGAVRRLTSSLDARDYNVIPIAAPTDEERAQHYLWRFWRHLSRAGRATIFDRSWYGRVLVERIEGFASEREWMRAYGEINHFEERLVEHGIVLAKFWLHITKEEQLARFTARQQTPFKAWKLTDEDWRNREKWEDYEVAVNDMIARCSTRMAPWTLIEANNKRFARVKVLRTVADALQTALDATPAPKSKGKRSKAKAPATKRPARKRAARKKGK